MELKRTFDILNNLADLCPEKSDILAGKEKGAWVKYSVKDYVDLAGKTSCGLSESCHSVPNRIEPANKRIGFHIEKKTNAREMNPQPIRKL